MTNWHWETHHLQPIIVALPFFNMVIFHFANFFPPPEGNIISQWEVELLTYVARILAKLTLHDKAAEALARSDAPRPRGGKRQGNVWKISRVRVTGLLQLSFFSIKDMISRHWIAGWFGGIPTQLRFTHRSQGGSRNRPIPDSFLLLDAAAFHFFRWVVFNQRFFEGLRAYGNRQGGSLASFRYWGVRSKPVNQRESRLI